MSPDPVATEPTPPVVRHPAEEWKPRTLHLGWLLGASVAVVSILCLLIWSGALAPRVSSRFHRSQREAERLVVTVSIRNAAATTVRITSVSTPPGLRLRSAQLQAGEHPYSPSDDATVLGDLGREDIDLGATSDATATLVYDITDCDAATTTSGRIEMTAQTFLGVTRTDVLVDDLYAIWNVTGAGHSPRTACEGITDSALGG